MAFTDNRLGRYLKESREELRKVIWPSRAETVRHTLLVIVISVSVAVFLGVIDYALTQGVERLIQK